MRDADETKHNHVTHTLVFSLATDSEVKMYIHILTYLIKQKSKYINI